MDLLQPNQVAAAPAQAQEPMAQVAPVQAMPAAQNQARLIEDILRNPDVLKNFDRFLSYLDFMKCRQVSRALNQFVMRNPRFQGICKGKLCERFYRHVSVMNVDISFFWTEVMLTHFQYHRNSLAFKNYWHQAVSETLTKLVLCRCAFECDGFLFLLGRCAQLDTLVLNGCKLRDLDDLHSPAGRPRVGIPCDHEALPIEKSLEHLSIENMYKIEQCFMDYVIARTNGQLKSLRIHKCFVSDLVNEDPIIAAKAGRPSLGTMFNEFERNILRLLRVNRERLEQFSFEANGYQMMFFESLAAAENRDLLQVPDLTLVLTIAEPNVGYVPFVEFMQIPHPSVRKLDLQFMGYIANETFNQVIQSFKPTLEDFTLTIAGNNLSCRIPLDVSGVSEFRRLRRFVLRDSKRIGEREGRTLIGTRKLQSRQNITTLARLMSNIDVNLFQNFPPAEHLTALTFEQCVFNLEEFRLNLPLVAGSHGEHYSLITNLQLRGPWPQSVQGLIPALVQVMPDLETLALTYCTLGDAELTGLDLRAVFDIRRCLTVGLALINAGPNPTAEEVITNVNAHVMYNGPVERPKLSSLKKLRHLDLSGNIEISDISLFEALRFENLKTLELMSDNNISDTGLEFLRLFCPKLEEVNLKNCRRLSKYGLNRLILGCKRLRRIYTTPIVVGRTLEAFNYAVSPNFNEVVDVTATVAQTSAFTVPGEEFKRFVLS